MADLIIDVRSHLVVVVDNVRRHEGGLGVYEAMEQRPAFQDERPALAFWKTLMRSLIQGSSS